MRSPAIGTRVPRPLESDNESNDILGRAVQSVGKSIDDAHSPNTREALTLRARLDELGELVRQSRRLDSPVIEGSEHIDSVSRQLLDLLRRQVLLAAHAAGDAEGFAESHRLLMAIELLSITAESTATMGLPWMRHDANAKEVLAEVAHDMRSPLGAILFLVERVRSGQSGSVNEAQAKQLGLAYSAAFELNGLTSDLTELAHGGRRLTELDPMPFAISTIIHSVEALVRPIAEEKGLELVTFVPPRDVRIGNASALTRVLLNLCTNACKFTDAGRVVLSADVIDEDKIQFTVRDNGRGLPDELAAAFSPSAVSARRGFAIPASRRFSSTGLGLAICSRLVTAMGGVISLADTSPDDTRSGTALTFTLRLPRV